MSKRAEQKALKAYPAERGHLHDRPFQREGFVNGYEQAEKDTIERACTWLSRNYDIDLARFRKAMEEE